MLHFAWGRRGTLVCACAAFALVFACNTDDASDDGDDSAPANDDAPASSAAEETSDTSDTNAATSDSTTTGAEPAATSTTADTSEDALCERGCVATLAAKCPNGPKTQPQCIDDCKRLAMGPCAEPYETFRTCSDGKTLSCNAMGIPIVDECSKQQEAFFACLNGG